MANSIKMACCLRASASAVSMLRPSSAALAAWPSAAYSNCRDKRSRARMIWSLTRDSAETSCSRSPLVASASPALRNPLTLMADKPVTSALMASRVHRIMRRIVMSFSNCVIASRPIYSECCTTNNDAVQRIFSNCFTTYEYIGPFGEYIDK
ncbi:hypothetical protein D3C87_1643300 [compost metagenome]